MTKRERTKTQAYRHTDARRTNIPTSEDHVYMGDDDRSAIPFSPSPAGSDGAIRLSWRRKLDPNAIQTNALPLYIHEKVDPSAFVAQLSEPTSKGLFTDFNGLPKDARYDWYRHEGNWSNRMIRGNSVDVMASLAVRERLAGKVQMVFFDPPYGINFDSNCQPTTRQRGGGHAPAAGAPRRAFRDSYIDGLHSYMDCILSVATHARALLARSGSIFLQMGTDNVHRLSIILDEVFGAENRIATITFAKTGSTPAKQLPQVADWLLWYAKDREHVKFNQLYEDFSRKQRVALMSWHALVELSDGTCRKLTAEEFEDPEMQMPKGARIFQSMPLASPSNSTTGRSEPYFWNGNRYLCPPGEQWRVSHDGLDSLASQGRLIAAPGGRLNWKRYEEEVPGKRIHNLWPKKQSATDMHYVVETAESTIERCILMATDPGDLVLDPTCGSGTTALVSERWGRRWITIDTSAIPIALCRQRLLSAVHKWHLTMDGSMGQAIEAKMSGIAVECESPDSPGTNPASGFVYERVPYVSAGHLAYGRPSKSTLLVNRPIAKKGVLRISSPFTVESHSPWTHVSPAGVRDDALFDVSERDIEIRENVINALSTSGISIPMSESTPERWILDGIVPWLESRHERGITHEALLRGNGARVALAFVPDDRSAGAVMVNDLARDAARNRFDKLVVVAFHIEPGVDREKRGKLEVLTVRANNELTVSSLAVDKKDAAFVLIGEPTVDVRDHGDGRLQVEILGYQVYDSASGNMRPGWDPSDIDCWMLDTKYDGTSFFARRIHFPGKRSDRQIRRFKRELSRHIDPEQWEFMSSLISAPFARPETGRIAVRIVTQYGDEMLAEISMDPK